MIPNPTVANWVRDDGSIRSDTDPVVYWRIGGPLLLAGFIDAALLRHIADYMEPLCQASKSAET